MKPCQPLIQTGEKSFTARYGGPTRQEGYFFFFYSAHWCTHALEERNGPPSANQSLSKAVPRQGHAEPADTTMLFAPVGGAPTHLPLSTLSAHTEPISKGHSQKWHYKAECLLLSIDGYIWESVKHTNACLQEVADNICLCLLLSTADLTDLVLVVYSRDVVIGLELFTSLLYLVLVAVHRN